MRSVEVIQQLLISSCLLKWIELLPVQVLHQRVTEQIIIGGVPDDGRDDVDTGHLARAPPALAHDQLVSAALGLAHDNRLEQADGLDRGCQFGERVLIEHLPRLARVGHDPPDGQLFEICTRQAFGQVIVAVARSGRRPVLTCRGHRRRRTRWYQGTEPLPESTLWLRHPDSPHLPASATHSPRLRPVNPAEGSTRSVPMMPAVAGRADRNAGWTDPHGGFAPSEQNPPAPPSPLQALAQAQTHNVHSTDGPRSKPEPP